MNQKKILFLAPLLIFFLFSNVAYSTGNMIVADSLIDRSQHPINEVSVVFVSGEIPSDSVVDELILFEEKDPMLPSEPRVVYDFVELMPSYPEGDRGLMDYVKTNLNYPEKAVEEGTQGLVVVRFVVENDGEITNPQVTRELSPECDEEALRVVNSLPKWNPGKQNGRNVAVYFTLPVLFRSMGENVFDPQKDTFEIVGDEEVEQSAD